MKSKVHFIQLGCDKNRVDGEVMLGLLDKAGYEITPDAGLAGAIVVNTCGFIREAVQESIETVLEASEYKAAGTCKALIVAGCMATRYRDEILNEMPEADAVLAVTDYGKIISVLDRILRNQDFTASTDGDEKREASYNNDAVISEAQWNSLRLAGRKMTSMPHIAYVKIAEGCDNRCTYCTIPSIRGAYTERPMESILDECRRLISDGAREIVFVAQDTAKHSRVPELLREVAKLDGLTWLRLMYAYPEYISDELIEALASNEKICPYVDMPIQHASDSVLKQMGRKGSRKELTAAVKRLRDKIPGIALRTTLMVGFPGETEAEFEELCDFVREIRFDRLGVFVYSPEDGTPAARMKGKVKKSEANARRDKLMLIQQEIHREKQRALVGKVIDVMVDNFAADRDTSANRTFVGRTVRDAAEVDAVVTFTVPGDNIPVPGELIKVRVTGADDYDLTGEISTD